jgi:hypothetical protein
LLGETRTPLRSKISPRAGGDQADVDPVLLGQQAELVGLVDLHVAHPPTPSTTSAAQSPGGRM